MTYPFPLFHDVDPGQAVPSSESAFLPRVPLVLLGYGDPSVRHVAFVATGLSGEDHIYNLYDADGVLILIEQDVLSIPADLALIGGVIELTGDVPASHGNLRVEVFVNGSDGWTRSIGH